MSDHTDQSDVDPVDGLGSLAPEVAPPAPLREATAQRLRRYGLLADSAHPSVARGNGGAKAPPLQLARVARRLAELAAVALVAFAAGRFSAADGVVVTRDPAQEFVLLLYGAASAPGTEADRVAEYRAWAQELARNGRSVSGERLGAATWLVGSPQPFGDTSLRLQGYFIVGAADEREAVSLAERHPHVRHGGSIVVRRIEGT